MVIAQIMGGLGNQLGEYACGYSLAKYLGQELVLDVSDYKCKGYFRPYCLDKLQIGTHRKLVYPPSSSGFMKEECIPKDLRDNGLRVINLQEVKTREKLLEAVKGAGDIYLLGYGGLQYCTAEEREEIKAQYQLKVSSAAVEQFKKQIFEEYSVAVHIRRTDFVDLKMQSSIEFFQAGVAYMKIFYPNAQFYFFSDDIQYVKTQFGSHKNYHYVHLLGGMDADLEEFFCLSACDGRILSSRSTFSNWASELNQSKRKLDICQEDEGGKHINRDRVYLNKDAIDALCRQYQLEDVLLEKADSVSFVDKAFHLVSEDHNDEAIELIDRISMNSYGISEDNARDLTTLKEIALTQKGETGLNVALRIFYEQLQREHEDSDFHADYFRALYQAGRITESAIHAALANRLGNQENYQGYFETIQSVSLAHELYKFLRECPVRHFIFIPMESWNYYITYVKTLAVLLARMGQKVTYLNPVDILIEQDASDAVIAKKLLQHISEADGNYKHHIDLVSNPCICSGEKTHYLFQELTRQCADRLICRLW